MMKLLCDTHILLWAASQPEQLSPATTILLSHPENTLYFSAASLWEVSIKNSLGRADFQVNPRLLRRGLLDNGYQELPITSEHTVALDTLAPLHKDPFDRILIAQALVEGFILVTADELVAKYGGAILLV